MKDKRYQINIVLTKEEHGLVKELRDKYAVNISGCFKLLLRSYFEQVKIIKLNGIAP